MPDDDFKIPANEPVSGKLTVEIIKSLVSSADLGMKAAYLTLWMSLMDQERFIQFNAKCGEELVKHLKEKAVDSPFMFTFYGRKQTKNKKRFHTFIGHYALVSRKEYFERCMGWPKQGEPILLDQDDEPYSKDALRQRHLRLLEKLNYIKRGGM